MSDATARGEVNYTFFTPQEMDDPLLEYVEEDFFTERNYRLIVRSDDSFSRYDIFIGGKRSRAKR